MTSVTAIAGLGLAAVLAVAGCTGSGSSAPPSQQASRPASHPAAAPQWKITPVHCGRYSPAQQARWSDYGGLIFRYANTGTVPAAVQVRVNFVAGSTVLGSNVTAFEPVIQPGQHAEAEVGYPAVHVPAHFTCQVTSTG